ncbi:MAG: TerC family protein [Clostridia bacterium]|nr:TerC family protein [Clostridia bacterium]
MDFLNIFNLFETLWATISPIISITIIDLTLSLDNAAVIGLAIKDLPPDKRKKAAFIGAGGAILLRVIFTAIAIYLTRLPYISALGGLLLIWITWKLLAPNKEKDEYVKSSDKFWGAVLAIIIANLTMSFDNVMGVAGASNGNMLLVIFGLLLSIPILIFGSNWLAQWMNKQPFIIYIGGAVLAHTSVAMFFNDKGLNLAEYLGNKAFVIPWLFAAIILVWGWFESKKIILSRDTR